jgi:peptide deformylase
MSLDELVLTIYGDPVLRRVSENVTEFGSELKPLIDRMFEVMYEEEGVGLAAPQVGVSKQIMVLDVAINEEENHVGVLINPEILETGGTQKATEGCLSIPGLREEVTRHDWLRVRGVDMDRLNPIRRKLLTKRLKQIAVERGLAQT